MAENITYRISKQEDEKELCSLILHVFDYSVASHYSLEASNNFRKLISPQNMNKLKVTRDQIEIVAEHSGKIIGMIAIQNNCHISLLFVHQRFQNMGIGKKLIEEGIMHCKKTDSNVKTIDVCAAPNSITFYEKSGFVKNGILEEDDNGWIFLLMRKGI